MKIKNENCFLFPFLFLYILYHLKMKIVNKNYLDYPIEDQIQNEIYMRESC